MATSYKISDLPSAITVVDEDLLEVSQRIGAGVYKSIFIKTSDLRSSLIAAGDHDSLAGLNAGAYQHLTAAIAGTVVLNKLDADVAPTVNDDVGDGYAAGSQWAHVIADKTYFCQDATAGAAVWMETVGVAATQTLTNKTFDANGAGNSLSNIDVADLANGTDGELITWNAAGAPAVVAVGTATHVLTSNGVGVAPTFQASGSGGMDANKLTAALLYGAV